MLPASALLPGQCHTKPNVPFSSHISSRVQPRRAPPTHPSVLFPVPTVKRLPFPVLGWRGHTPTRLWGKGVAVHALPMDPSAATAVAIATAGVYAAWRLFRFAIADGDLGVLGKRAPPANAFDGKVVWLVGASQGLGETISRYFSSRGARVILSARNVAELQRVAAECGGDGRAAVVPLDIKASWADMGNAVDAAYSAFDGAKIDILVHIVGASQRSMAEETTPEVDREMFELNALGPIRLTKAVLPRMLEARSGHIAVVSSMAGVLPSPGQSTYAATKHALQGFFKSLAVEVCDRGVGVSLVCPGPVTADPSKPARKVYGATGMVEAADSGSLKTRVSPQRVAELLGTAVYHNCAEVWAAKHPVLALAYVFRFLPALGWMVLRKVGPKRARAVRDGKSGYDVQGLVGSAGSSDKAKSN